MTPWHRKYLLNGIMMCLAINGQQVAEIRRCVENAYFDGMRCKCYEGFLKVGSQCLCGLGYFKSLKNPECVRCPNGMVKNSFGNELSSCTTCQPDGEFAKHVINFAFIDSSESQELNLTIPAAQIFNTEYVQIHSLAMYTDSGNSVPTYTFSIQNGEANLPVYQISKREEWVVVGVSEFSCVSAKLKVFGFKPSLEANSFEVFPKESVELKLNIGATSVPTSLEPAANLYLTKGGTRFAFGTDVTAGALVDWIPTIFHGGQEFQLEADLVIKIKDTSVLLYILEQDPFVLGTLKVAQPFDFEVSPWSNCSTQLSCFQAGVQSRKVSCLSQAGSVPPILTNTFGVSVDLCSLYGLKRPESERRCYPEICRQWDLSDWTTCGQSCGSKSTRIAECTKRSTGEVFPNVGVCNGELSSDIILQRPCAESCVAELKIQTVTDGECKRTIKRCQDSLTGRLLKPSMCGIPYEVISESTECKSIGSWSECSQNCGSEGKTKRAVLDSKGVIINWEERSCNNAPCDPVLVLFGESSGGDIVCLNKNLQFVSENCDSTALGKNCESLCLSTSSISSRRLSSSAAEAAEDLVQKCQGLVTPSGRCCGTSEALDSTGNCCPVSDLDACGVCGGQGAFVDMNGNCCSQLDAAGHCCDNVDLLGVCEGTKFSQSEENPVCGNGVCEIGEACSASFESCCLQDCPYPIKACPNDPASSLSCGGAGKCQPSIGKCDCFLSSGRVSHDDFSCSLQNLACRHGFTATSKGCLLDSVIQSSYCTNGKHDERVEDGVDCGGICSTPCTTETPTPQATSPPATLVDPSETWKIVAIAVGGVIGLVLLVLGFLFRRSLAKILAKRCCCCFWRRDLRKGTSVRQFPGFLKGKTSEPKTPDQKVEPDLTLDTAMAEFDDTRSIDLEILAQLPGPPPEIDDEVRDERLRELELREELVSREIVFEGWLKEGKKNAKVYAVLKPIGDLLFYKEMLPSGYGNVHINHLKSMNIQSCVDARKSPPRFRRRSSSSGGRRSSIFRKQPNLSKSGSETTVSESISGAVSGEKVFELDFEAGKSLSATRTMSFEAPTAEEADEWIKCITCLIKMFKEQQGKFQLGRTPTTIPPPPPQTPDLPNSSFSVPFEVPNMLSSGGSRDFDVEEGIENIVALRRTNTAPPVPRYPAPSVPLQPDVPGKDSLSVSLAKAKRRKKSSADIKSRSRSRSRTQSRSSQRSLKAIKMPRSSSTSPPPLPPWPLDQEKNEIRRASSLPATTRIPRTRSAATSSAMVQSDQIWDRFQRKMG